MTTDGISQSGIDTQKISTAFVSKILDRIYEAAEKKVREGWARRRNEQLAELSQLVELQVTNYRVIKNILYYNEPVALNGLYVGLRFSKERYAMFGTDFDRHSRSDEAIVSALSKGKRIIICGTAGAGKSFFLRRALLTLCNGTADTIPLFFELRNLNGKPKTAIVDGISENILGSRPLIS